MDFFCFVFVWSYYHYEKPQDLFSAPPSPLNSSAWGCLLGPWLDEHSGVTQILATSSHLTVDRSTDSSGIVNF